jgi:hypothetical protein
MDGWMDGWMRDVTRPTIHPSNTLNPALPCIILIVHITTFIAGKYQM